MVNPQHLIIRIMKEKHVSINPAIEEELKQILDDIWKNRSNLTESSMLSLLKKISNKKYGCPLR